MLGVTGQHRFDTRNGTAQVRPVGAEAPAGRKLQLWYVGAAGPKLDFGHLRLVEWAEVTKRA